MIEVEYVLWLFVILENISTLYKGSVSMQLSLFISAYIYSNNINSLFIIA